MRTACLCLFSAALLLPGCASGFRQGSSGGANAGVGSRLSAPSPRLGTSDKPATEPGSSFFSKPFTSDKPAAADKPSISGPTLGLPEARQPADPFRTAQAPAEGTPKPAGRFSFFTDRISATGRPALLDAPVWNRYYTSTDRRPVETLALGNGPYHILLLASMHGDEPQSVALVDELARYLRGRPEQLQESTLLLVRSPNPDGYYARTPENINGVDLNRNFPAENWQQLAANRAGERPASEVETRVVQRLIGDFRPALIIHLKDGRSGGVVNYEGAIRERAETVARRNSYRVANDLGQATSGSLENYAATRLKRPCLTLLLPIEASDHAAWERNREALLAAVSVTVPRRSNGQASPGDDQSSPRAKTAPQRRALPKAGAAPVRGISAEFPASVPARGYLELPPSSSD